jgi:SAM-dependent methyltransferase
MGIQKLWRAGSDAYRGLPVRCAPGVHEVCLAAIEAHARKNARVLDLASGSGAFLARLRDAGFADLTGVERDAATCGAPGVRCVSLDLDRPFAAGLDGRFDVVSAIEIIEHLSSPIAFLREICALLSDDGVALISTPNIAEWRSRLKFLLKGELRHFDDRQYRYQRHVSPVVPALVPALLEEAGLSLVSMHAAGSFDGPLQRYTLAGAASLVARLGKVPMANGDCLIILARHAVRDAAAQ